MNRAVFALLAVLPYAAWAATPEGWEAFAPRDEIRPQFAWQPAGGPEGRGCLVIQADAREGLHGCWTRTFPVIGGRYYAFHVLRKTEGIPYPRRHVLVTITWQNAKGDAVQRDTPTTTSFRTNQKPQATPEFPLDGATNAQGWTEIAGVYAVPRDATQARVELHLRWAPEGKVEWADAMLTETRCPPPRRVRIAVAHFQPRGGASNAEQCRLYEPLLEQAAQQRADLVVLGETLTYAFRKPHVEIVDAAEPIPGPSTEYFVGQAKRHNYYIVAGLVERAGTLVYNTAALVGPEGLVGKYRKVTLPRSEWSGGVAPGHEYPVFPTRFGRVGIMICYDGFYPEVARQLSAHGAEIIAFPVWGCNPDLARARAIENQVYVASSTYTDAKSAWMQTAVYDHSGRALVEAREWGTIAVAEVDLSQPTHWHSLGNYKEEHQRHRPRWEADD
jgi:predicted amidohydrolase